MFRSLPGMVVLAPRPKKKKAGKVFGDRRGLGFRHLVVKPANLGKVLTYRQRKPPKPRHGKHAFNCRGSLGFWPVPRVPIKDNGKILLYRQRKPPKPKHGKRTFNGTSLGFWPVPDNGYIGSAAIALRLFNAAAAASEVFPATASIALSHLTVHGEARYGPDNNPGRVTLPKLSVSAAGQVFAPANTSHDIYWKYNARDGGPIASWVKRYTGSRQVQIKRTVPAHTVDQEFDLALLSSTTLTLTLFATDDAVIKLNPDRSQTIALDAATPIIWTHDSGIDFPFTSDVESLFVTNPNDEDIDFTIAALIMDSSN